MGEVRNGDQKVRKYLFSEILYGRQAVFYEVFFSRIIWVGGVKKFPSKFRQLHNLKISNRLLRSKIVFQKNIPSFICSVCVPFLGSKPVTTEGIRVSWTNMDVRRY